MILAGRAEKMTVLCGKLPRGGGWAREEEEWEEGRVSFKMFRRYGHSRQQGGHWSGI